MKLLLRKGIITSVIIMSIALANCKKDDDGICKGKNLYFCLFLKNAISGNSNGVSNCNGENVTRNWGTFTDDCQNSIVKLEVTAGTFGGKTYTAKTLYFAKCSHGQTYDSSSNTCTGSGTKVKYFSLQDNSCNGGTDTGTLNGGGTSEAYTACNGLSLASKTWRVPTKDELKLLINCSTTTEMPADQATCTASTSTNVNNLFPNTLTDDAYWSSSSAGAPGIFGWSVDYTQSQGRASLNTKDLSKYLRCVSE